MLKQHARMVAWLLYAADIAVTVVSFIISYWLRNTYIDRVELKGLYPFRDYAWLLLVIIPVWTILLFQFRVYRSYRTHSVLDELFSLSKVVISGGLVIGALSFILKTTYLSRTFILLFMITSIVLLGAERLVVRMASHVVRRLGYNFRNVIIVGIGETAREICSKILAYQEWGLRIVGMVTDQPGNCPSSIDGCPVVGTLTELEDIVHRHVVDEVIFAVPGRNLEELEDTLLMLEEHGINVRLVANIFPHVIAKIHVEELETIPLLSFTTIPTDTVALAVKRAFDLTMTLFLLVFLSPLMLVTAAVVKFTSPGPVLFRQKRCGLNGRTFTLYKFRSMYDDAEDRKKDLESLNEMEGPVFKIKDDPRITPLGRFLRRTSIDELPQLWNVLKGDMSIVGPRPPVPEEVGKYERWQRRRLSMRPGLTCLWQISGRNRIRDFKEWVRLDLQYIDTWSLTLDLKIFLKTIPVVLLSRGAE